MKKLETLFKIYHMGKEVARLPESMVDSFLHGKNKSFKNIKDQNSPCLSSVSNKGNKRRQKVERDNDPQQWIFHWCPLGQNANRISEYHGAVSNRPGEKVRSHVGSR